MKKFRIGCMLMLVTAMAVVFTACGGDDSGNNNETSTENVSQNNNDMNNAGNGIRDDVDVVFRWCIHLLLFFFASNLL